MPAEEQWGRVGSLALCAEPRIARGATGALSGWAFWLGARSGSARLAPPAARVSHKERRSERVDKGRQLEVQIAGVDACRHRPVRPRGLAARGDGCTAGPGRAARALQAHVICLAEAKQHYLLPKMRICSRSICTRSPVLTRRRRPGGARALRA